MGLFLRISSIFLAILVGFMIYYFLVYPLILKKMCLVETDNCVKISYYMHKNSALVNVQESDYWLWYNGDTLFLYGHPLGEVCSPSYDSSGQSTCTSEQVCKFPPCIDGKCACDPNNPPFQAVYTVDLKSGITAPKGYECVRDLRCIMHFYKSKNAKKLTSFIRRKNPETFGIVDIVNELLKQKIINITPK